MAKDYIWIEGLKLFAHHGVYEKEKIEGQGFVLDIGLSFDMTKAGKSDDLSDTVNYAEVAEFAVSFVEDKVFDLIEKVAGELAYELLKKFSLLSEVSIRLHKPNAPVELEFNDISVNITRRWNTAVLAVGSNMGEKEVYINNALCKLKDNSDFKDIRESSLIITKPYGGVEQDDFVNGAVIFKTLLSPEELLSYIHCLEKEANRERLIHWGPRTLDLDIIFYEDRIIDTPDLKVPHIDMENRTFVLEPLMEICPYYVNQVNKKTVSVMLKELREKEGC